jgi:hypothetical protein
MSTFPSMGDDLNCQVGGNDFGDNAESVDTGG